MVKLNKQYEMLEATLDKIYDKITELEEKKAVIEDLAADEDRDYTKAEERKLDKLDEQIEELEQELDDVRCAMDYLKEYVV